LFFSFVFFFFLDSLQLIFSSFVQKEHLELAFTDDLDLTNEGLDFGEIDGVDFFFFFSFVLFCI
jgi:hypothetical protein